MIITALAYLAMTAIIFTAIVFIFGITEQDDDLILVVLLSIAWPALIMIIAFACIIGAVFKIINTIAKLWK